MTGRGRRWAAAAALAATMFVAVAAFVLAYDGSKGAATDAGMTPGKAGWYPACIEGVLVVAAICTVVLDGRRLPWAVLLGFSGLSVAANVVHAHKHGTGEWVSFSSMVAAVPPFALPLCVHMAIEAVRKLVEPVKSGGSDQRSDVHPTQPDSPNSDPTYTDTDPIEVEADEKGVTTSYTPGGRRPRRSPDEIRAEVRRLIDTGRLPQTPTADQIRAAVGGAQKTAQQIRDELAELVEAGR